MSDEKKGMSIGSFAQDKDKATNGTWVDIGAGLRLKIARSNTPQYKKQLRKAGKPFLHQMRTGSDAAAEIAEKITREVMAKSILLDWENLLDDDEVTEIVYSEAKALELLTKHQDFFELVEGLSQDQTIFAEATAEESAGN